MKKSLKLFLGTYLGSSFVLMLVISVLAFNYEKTKNQNDTHGHGQNGFQDR